jgi:hypothetical protein
MLFGEHQRSDEARSLFARCMPFAEVVETSALCWAITESGAYSLANSADAGVVGNENLRRIFQRSARILHDG